MKLTKTSKLVPLLVGLLLTACSMDPAPQDPPKEESAKSEMEEKDDDMVGLSQGKAETMAAERGLKSRVISVDGDDRPVTMDYLPNRVNFTIEGGKVIGISRG